MTRTARESDRGVRSQQLRIVAEVDRRLSVVDEPEALVSANLRRATCLRQSILQRAFAGEFLHVR